MRWRFVRAPRVWPRRASPTHVMDSFAGDASLGRLQAFGPSPTLGSRALHSRPTKVLGQICVVWPPALLQQRVCSHLGRLAARLVLATPCLFNFSETSHTHLRVYQSTSRGLQKQGFAQYSAPAGLVTSLELLLSRGLPSPRWISLPAQVACDV